MQARSPRMHHGLLARFLAATTLFACSGRSELSRPDASAPSAAIAPMSTTSESPEPIGADAGSTGDPSPSTKAVSAPAQGFVIDHASIDAFDRIPAKFLAAARSTKVFYGRLSHGDQLIGGLAMVQKARGAAYDASGIVETFYSSLDPGRETPEWEKATRERLNKVGPSPTVVMWAWSGNVGRPDRGGTDEYVMSTLQKMNVLEKAFPRVRFVYFTGPSQTWKGATDYTKHNAMIRKFAKDHGKVLFDFEDIDSHSPDGVDHPDDTDACEWCEAWCKSHDCSMLDANAKCVENHHTHCLNDYRKGQAVWVLLARLAGWDGP